MNREKKWRASGVGDKLFFTVAMRQLAIDGFAHRPRCNRIETKQQSDPLALRGHAAPRQRDDEVAGFINRPVPALAAAPGDERRQTPVQRIVRAAIRVAPALDQQTKVAQRDAVTAGVVKRRLDVEPAVHSKTLYPRNEPTPWCLYRL